MRPFLFYSDGFSIPSFTLMLMMASLVPTAIAYKMAQRRGLSPVVILDLGIWGTLAAILGGRLFHVLVEAPLYYWEQPGRILEIWRGGWVSYGAFIGIAVAWTLYLRLRHLDTLTYFDHVILFAGPFIDFFVRLGCLLAGCCYGKPSPFHSGEYLLYQKFYLGDAGYYHYGVALWPTQIYSLLAAVLIFLICLWVDHRKTFKGQVSSVFLMSYAVLRGLIEFSRGDASRGLYFQQSISTGQVMSLISFTIAVILYFYCKRHYPLSLAPKFRS